MEFTSQFKIRQRGLLLGLIPLLMFANVNAFSDPSQGVVGAENDSDGSDSGPRLSVKWEEKKADDGSKHALIKIHNEGDKDLIHQQVEITLYGKNEDEKLQGKAMLDIAKGLTVQLDVEICPSNGSGTISFFGIPIEKRITKLTGVEVKVCTEETPDKDKEKENDADKDKPKEKESGTSKS